MRAKKLEIDLPAPPPSGGFHSSPSGDTEYEDAMEKWRQECNAKILKAVPRGFSLKGVERKTSTVVRHFAVLDLSKDG